MGEVWLIDLVGFGGMGLWEERYSCSDVSRGLYEIPM